MKPFFLLVYPARQARVHAVPRVASHARAARSVVVADDGLLPQPASLRINERLHPRQKIQPLEGGLFPLHRPRRWGWGRETEGDRRRFEPTGISGDPWGGGVREYFPLLETLVANLYLGFAPV